MISIRKNLLLIIVYALITLDQLMVTTIEAQLFEQQQSTPFIAGLPTAAAASSNNIIINGHDLVGSGGASRQQSSMPGHYEFEVAPKMEPPSVRRPPYQQSSTQTCAGSDPFAGFSPKDTLCGNLNEGRVPINPLGQNINDQSYPFELIKNKTLQFLARALPVLKLEYETIPKVARYLPGQHLLNPTHLSSPLGHEHFHRLNQRLAPNDFSPAATNPFLAMADSGAGRRRRKRSLAHASYTVAAELSPNASLLVSSAHSAPGRIRDFMGHQSGPDNGGSPPALAVITKDGYRPVAHQTLSRLAQSGTNSAHPAPKPAPSVEQSNNTRSASPSLSQNKVGGPENRQQQQQQPQPQPQQATGSTQASQSITAGNSQPQRNHAKATTADSGQGAAQVQAEAQAQAQAKAELAAQAARSAVELQHQQAGQLTKHQQQQQQPQVAHGTNSTGGKEQSSSGLSKRRSLMSCSDSANGFSSAICQAAVALIEGTERQPVWLQVVKQLGSAFAGSADQMSGQSASAANNPIWSILSGLSAVSQAYSGASNNEAQSKSAGQQSSRKPTIMSLIGPISSLLTSGGGGGGGGNSSSRSSSPSSDTTQTKAADLASSSSSLGSALANSLGSSTVAKLALAGWASNAVAGLLDYFAPSLFSSAAGGFSRRKKPYDPLEQFVDTPASLAALTAAAASQQQSRQAASGPLNSQAKQPPTPCPSVEEYISPTFARNYQGTWKYVIQIPHEGYFTQTIQRTSCVRQRCEFTDGVCHESPRWVSLLVAEIYYPHAVFSQPGGDQAGTGSMMQQQQQHPMSAAPSMSSIQQVQPAQQRPHLQRSQGGSIAGQSDPLQMTDSLNTYNHNLNSAFIEAANGLGLDPNNVANMQQLADAYNYQLLQRNGLLPGQQQQQQMESRSQAAANPLIGAASSHHYSIQPPANQPLQPQQQQLNPNSNSNPSSNANNDYILSLAAAALQQNPHLSISDLIASLQQSVSRKKRDSPSGRSSSNSWSAHQQPGHKIQQRSSTNNVQPIDQAVNHPITNEIPSAGQPSQQQQAPFGKANPLDSSLQHHQADSPAVVVSNPTSTVGSSQGQTGGDNADQTECDGHDKIGCYVVRVYYDWFLVNGSCKCWKTTGQQQQQSGQQAGNSFLRRIFTG